MPEEVGTERSQFCGEERIGEHRTQIAFEKQHVGQASGVRHLEDLQSCKQCEHAVSNNPKPIWRLAESHEQPHAVRSWGVWWKNTKERCSMLTQTCGKRAIDVNAINHGHSFVHVPWPIASAMTGARRITET